MLRARKDDATYIPCIIDSLVLLLNPSWLMAEMLDERRREMMVVKG